MTGPLSGGTDIPFYVRLIPHYPVTYLLAGNEISLRFNAQHLRLRFRLYPGPLERH